MSELSDEYKKRKPRRKRRRRSKLIPAPEQKPKRVSDLSDRLRTVYERDDGLCHLCDRYVLPEDATADHIIQACYGGTAALENLALAHRACNEFRANMDVEEARFFIHGG